MIFDRTGIVRALFPRKSAAAEAGVRWVRAVRAEPGIMDDVIRLGAVLAVQPDLYQDGVPMGAPIDPVRLAYEAGKRDMAVQLCALMGLTVTELRHLMEDIDAD